MKLAIAIFVSSYLLFSNGIESSDFEFDVNAIIQELIAGQLLEPILNLNLFPENNHLNIFNSDPDLYRNTTELIRSKGYPCEEHDVETEDGFILGLQRIPPKNNSLPSSSPVVFVVHGLFDSSATWVINLRNQSLGFLLADAGCDVWLGNVRGNVYSRRHKKLNPDSAEFWDWSWDEMAKYDIPAMIKYISMKTSSKNINYIGHSQGTLVAFASLSRNTELQQSVTKLFTLAPVATLGHINGFLKVLAKFNLPQVLSTLLGVHEFLPSQPLVKWIISQLCSAIVIDEICSSVVIMGGLSYESTNKTRIPVYLSHAPAGTSTKNVMHFAQLVNSKKFQMFDYEREGNLKRYNQTTPPLYYLRDIITPTYVFYGGKDNQASPEDSLDVIQNLTNLVWAEEIPDFKHWDFIWRLSAAEQVYKKIITFLFTP